MGLVSKDDGWRIPDWLWERIEPLLPPPAPHRLGCHKPRVPAREAMNAILLVLRTGMRWNALNVTGVCSSSSAHRRLQEWERAGVLPEIWRQGLLDYDEAVGIDWAWLAADGAMAKAPLGALRTGPNPTDRAKGGPKRSLLVEAAGVTLGLDHEGANGNDHKLLKATLDSSPIEPPEPSEADPQGLCLDKAYDNQGVRDLIADYDLTPQIRARGGEIELKQLHPDGRARRWLVEAAHSWLNRNRAILIRWSKEDENHLALLQLASGLVAFKKAHAARLAPALPGIGPKGR
ncbi:MAG TPA: IS5 family transposase [Solirubrobacterales bacterium]|nr:IS5 family transposase [Solirubrobacterales bacterium]